MKKFSKRTYAIMVEQRMLLTEREAEQRNYIENRIKVIDGTIELLNMLKEELADLTEEYTDTVVKIKTLNALLEDEEA